MRLLIIGSLKGQLGTATKIAVGRGAAVTHAVDVEQGMRVLRARGTDLIMADVAVDIRDLVNQLGGGGTVSLRIDAQGKTFSAALLRMEIDVPDGEIPARGMT
jgi:hypothetical protein